MFPLWVAAVLFAPNAISLVAREEYLAAAPVCTVLLCATYARMQLPFLLRQLHFLRKTWTLPLITIPTTILSLGVLIATAAQYGIMAAAWVALGTDLIILVSLALVVQRLEHIEYPILTALLFTAFLASLAIWTNFGGPEFTTWTTTLVKALIAAAAGLAAVLFWIWPERRLILQLAKG
jgi:hypothetical protein